MFQAELDKRRARAMHHYRSELERIESIARGARSRATENQRYVLPNLVRPEDEHYHPYTCFALLFTSLVALSTWIPM